MSQATVQENLSWRETNPPTTTPAYGYGSGRFGHPEQDRALSLRGLLFYRHSLQTMNFGFAGPEQRVVMKTLGRLVGNAVLCDSEKLWV